MLHPFGENWYVGKRVTLQTPLDGPKTGTVQQEVQTSVGIHTLEIRVPGVGEGLYYRTPEEVEVHL